MMRLLCISLLALAGFQVSLASGQVRPPPPFSGYRKPWILLLVESKDAQKDLNLSDEQIRKISALSKKYTESVKGLGNQKAEEREKARRAEEATKAELAETLDADQALRLKQLELQHGGIFSFLSPQVSKELVITPDQQSVINNQGRNVPRMVAILEATKGNHQEYQTKMTELYRNQLDEFTKKLMTADQQAKWRKMSGPPFTGVFPFPY